MDKKIVIFSAVLTAALLLISVNLPANARATRTPVSSFEYDCAVSMEKMWMEGQVMHIRNYKHVNLDVSDNPELDGINTTVADAEINLVTGDMLIRGTMSFKPDGIDGTWEGTWTSITTKGVSRTESVAQGTGALAGKTLFLNIADAAPTSQDQAMCQGLGEWEGNVTTEGYILDTGSH